MTFERSRHIHKSRLALLIHLTLTHMDGITIYIGWEYFLGIIGALIAVAWYSNGRFTALENSMEWIMNTLRDLKAALDKARS
jgi:hypothetical protein